MKQFGMKKQMVISRRGKHYFSNTQEDKKVFQRQELHKNSSWIWV